MHASIYQQRSSVEAFMRLSLNASSTPGRPSRPQSLRPVPCFLFLRIVSASQQINSYKTMVVMNRYCFPDRSRRVATCCDEGLLDSEERKRKDSSGLLKSAADSLESGYLSPVSLRWRFCFKQV